MKEIALPPDFARIPSAHQRISISDDEFRATPPAGGADTHTRIRSIQKTGGQFAHKLIEKIAWKRAGQQKRQAELISSQHTRKRVLTEFEETVARDLGVSRLRYENDIRAPLVRRGVSPARSDRVAVPPTITLALSIQ